MAEYECTGSYVVCSKCVGSWCYVKDLPWYPSCWCGRPYPDQAAPVVWPAAAASSSVTVSADAGPAAVPAARVYDIAFFITYKDFTGHWQQHSAALKCIRGDQENAKDPERAHSRSPSRTTKRWSFLQSSIPLAWTLPSTSRRRSSGRGWRWWRSWMTRR